MNPVWSWLKDSGTQAVELFITACAAIGAFLLTWYFGKKSLTKKDLVPIEQNTGHLDDVRSGIASVDNRLKKQEEADALRISVSRVSITASGNQSGNAPYPLYLSVKNSTEQNLSITHVELCNERDTSFGSFSCSRIDNPSVLDFQAAIPMTTIGDWFRAGTPVQTSNRMRLKLRVWMSVDGIEVSRDMAATVIETLGSGYPGYTLNGSV